ncbi:hypothetical protein ACFYNO_40285 [Kitasatospora sp. NPDC006697]|uniref:hypothetical protein n=1 Tax=Kitasatospora sp. NPDC006697 TaxID=3364020 RepID=UPI00367F1673
MPDLQEAQQLAETLAMTAATTVTAAMGTEAWQATRGRLARLLHRRGREVAEVERELDGQAALVTGAEAEEARAELVPPLRRQLLAVLRTDPRAVAELQALIDEVRGSLPADAPGLAQNVQHIKASDHAIVNAVQGGTQNNHFMDRPRRSQDQDQNQGQDQNEGEDEDDDEAGA